jgi:hypothetical protein
MDIINYKPSPTQQEFHLADEFEVLYGGAAGGGKSVALLWDIVFQMMGEHQRWMRGEIPRSMGWAIYFRRTVPRLAETENRASILFREIDPKVHYNGDSHTYTFSCGYKAQFAHLQHTEDADNYRSTQFTLVEFDELTEFEETQYDFLTARVRPPGGWVGPVKVRCATNPGGRGSAWVKKRFIDPAPDGRVRLSEKVVMSDGTTEEVTRLFIPAKLSDNPDAKFKRDYEKTLRTRKNANIVEMWLHGNWNFVDGAFFAESFDPRIHVCEPFKIPDSWTRFRAMDWGLKTMGTVGWWAKDEDDNLVKYREFNFRGLDAEEVALRIGEIEQQNGEWNEKRNKSLLSGPADYAIWEERGNIGPSIAETMANCGVEWERCTKNRHAGSLELLRRLNDKPDQGKGAPGIRYFKTCERSVATIPTIPSDPHDPEVPEDGGDDHWLDESMYAVMYRLAAPKVKARSRRGELFDELEEQRKKNEFRGKTGYGR